MAIERIAPGSIITSSNYTLPLVTSIQDDPDAPGSFWLNASDEGTDTDIRCEMDDPSNDLEQAANLQEVRALVRKSSAGGTDPGVDVEIWQNGTFVSRPISNLTITSTTGEIVSANFTAPSLTGAGVEIRVLGMRSGGSPANRRTVELGALEWNADVTAVTDDLTADDVEAASEAAIVTMGQTHVVGSTDLETFSELNPVAFGQTHPLGGDGIETASEIGGTQIGTTHVLGVTGAESASEASSVLLGVQYAFQTVSVEAQSEFLAPQLTQTHNLLQGGVEAVPQVSEPIQGGVADADDVSSFAEVEAPAMGQVHALLIGDIEVFSEISAPTMAQTHLLGVDQRESASETSTESIGQTHTLATADVASPSEASEPEVSGATTLTPISLEAWAEINNPVLGQTNSLLAADVITISSLSVPFRGPIDPANVPKAEATTIASPSRAGSINAAAREVIEARVTSRRAA